MRLGVSTIMLPIKRSRMINLPYQLLSMADNTGANLGQPLVIDKAQYVCQTYRLVDSSDREQHTCSTVPEKGN